MNATHIMLTKIVLVSLTSMALLVSLLLMTDHNLYHDLQTDGPAFPVLVRTASSKGYGVTGNNKKSVAPAPCRECEFWHSHRDPETLPSGSPPSLVRVTSTHHGSGRTGNYVTSLFLAMKLAYACKSTLELPRTDERGGAFHFQQRLFDFTQRPGNASVSPLCEEEFVGSAGKFWSSHRQKFKFDGHGQDLYRGPVLATNVTGVDQKLWTCMRQFLGLCVEGFCTEHQSVAQDGVLVVHLRTGDIYKSNYSDRVNRKYQQPFLAYYYSIINFTNPEKILFVGEGGNQGPIWDAFEDMRSFGIAKFAIEFQSLSLVEDMQTMLCARKFVASYSTLMNVIRLGFATQRFSPYPCDLNSLSKEHQVYHVDAGEFNGGEHVNSAEEWLAMLLNGKSLLPRLCKLF